MSGSAATADGDGAAPAAEPRGDTIARRTRTQLSLVDVPIDALEELLPEAAEPPAEETEEDREYQRFLSSLLPQEQENLSFLDEEDEEYHPEEDEEEDEDDPDAIADAANERPVRISRKELTELLWDSTQLRIPPPGTGTPYMSTPLATPAQSASITASSLIAIPFPAANLSGPTSATTPRAARASNEAVVSDDTAPDLSSSGAQQETSQMLPSLTSPDELNRTRRRHKSRTSTRLQNMHGKVTQEQCVQLASQIHKHMQLLLQNYHALVSTNDNSMRSTLAQCRKMMNDLQLRADKAQRYKGSLLSKANVGAEADDETELQPGAAPNSTLGTDSVNKRKVEDALALRRVTRSLTAAHAAVTHPSMFELVGSQSIDELSAVFRRGCSVDERNAVLKEHMMELDAHLITTHRKDRHRAFTRSEEELLAEGIKRFGTSPNSWERIRDTFLPNKGAEVIQHRYKYLLSSKAKTNAVKTMHEEGVLRRKEGWLIEEDLRIARGLIELFHDKKRFFEIAKRYLPHRSRTEIRKRWERIVSKLRQYVADVVSPPVDERSLEYVIMVREYLELKLHEQAKIHKAANVEGGHEKLLPSVPFTKAMTLSGKSQRKSRQTHITCRVKNLHPALFFTSWSLINPAVLLELTCEHNWPTFIETVKPPSKTAPKLIQAEIASPVTGAAQPIEINKETSGKATKTTDQIGPVQETPEPQVETTAEQANEDPLPHVDMDGFEQVPDFNLSEEDDEDDSDYEHDELLSSENEESESEFEQMELSDDDEEDEEADITGEEYDWSDEGDHDVELLTSDGDDDLDESSESQNDDSEPSIRHPLRLQNLLLPDNGRIKLALAALERRMVTKAATPQRPDGAFNAGWTGARAQQRRTIVPTVVSSRVTPYGSTTAFSASNFQPANNEKLPLPTPAHNEDDDWANGSGDESFECDELLESSEDDEDEEDTEEGQGFNLSTMSLDEEVTDGFSDVVFPNKRPRLSRKA